MQKAEVGYFKLSVDGEEFSFAATFENMSKIADSKRILIWYEIIHNPTLPTHTRLAIGGDVLLACCNKPEKLYSHLVHTRKGKPHITNKTISINDQIVVGAALLRHGIAGVNRPKWAGSTKASKSSSEFDVNKIVADAMIHLGLTRNEAWKITMSEFCRLLAAKMPPESVGHDAPSMDDHKAVMKELMEKNNGR